MKLFFLLACLAVMAVYIYVEGLEKWTAAVILKGCASLLFVLLGFECSKVFANTQFCKMVRIGLVLGLIADILLNLRFVFKAKGKIVFLVGILVFLAGHVLYLCALVPTVNNVLIPIIVGVILSALLLKWIFTKIEAEKAFKIFGVFYIGVIVIMNCFAFANLAQDITNTRYIVFTIGAVLFLASDIVLILNTFGKESKRSLRITNLVLYYLGQILIAFSMMLPVLTIA